MYTSGLTARRTSSERRKIADDANHRQPGRLRLRAAETDAAAERILARPGVAGERLVDDRDERRVGVILLGERPAGHERGPPAFRSTRATRSRAGIRSAGRASGAVPRSS